ncbi:MAG: TRAP transporter small permease [bacterium]
MKAYDRFLDIISKLVGWIASALLTAMVLIVTWQVFARYVLKNAPAWSEEISLILVVWFGLLGAGLGVRDGSHLAVEFLVRGLKPGAQRFFHRLSFALIISFSTLMIVSGFRLVALVGGHGESNAATGIPVAVTYMAIPVAGIFIFMHAIRHLIGLFGENYEIVSATIETETVSEKEADAD